MNALHALDWVERIAALGLLLSALEWLAVADMWQEHGPAAWRVFRVRSLRWGGGPAGRVLDALFGSRGCASLLLIQLGGSAAVMVPTSRDAHVAAVSVAAVATLALRLRLDWGNDGGDRNLALIMVASLLGRLVGTPFAAVAVLWFLAAQCCLAYWTAGLGKLRQRDWRSGAVLRDVFSSTLLGAPRLDAWFERSPMSAAWLSRLVIANFCLFPLVFVVPTPIALGLIAGGCAFHLATATLMGLNLFPWAFLATYPAIVYCARI